MTTQQIPATVEGILSTLRGSGWQVAIHNDYHLNGVAHTFWLFTHSTGIWIKGEGISDLEALSFIIIQINAIQEALQPFIKDVLSNFEAKLDTIAIEKWRSLSGTNVLHEGKVLQSKDIEELREAAIQDIRIAVTAVSRSIYKEFKELLDLKSLSAR
jgi:hypothetical protein